MLITSVLWSGLSRFGNIGMKVMISMFPSWPGFAISDGG